MIKSNTDALGIIFPNSYDTVVPELVVDRTMASIPFAGRYRMIDFVLSSMVNCGIDNISVIVRKNYHSLMDHLGAGREWDLTRKNGGLNIVPPFAQAEIKSYSGRVDGLASILNFLRSQKEKYVVVTNANIAVNFDFNKLIRSHIEKEADITIAYMDYEIPAHYKRPGKEPKEQYYTLKMDENGQVQNIIINDMSDGVQNFGMCIYAFEREFLIKEIEIAHRHGYVHLERDILIPKLSSLKIMGYKYEGYAARIDNMKGYFDENMKLLKAENLDALFNPSPVYTKIRDDNPTRYITGASAKNVMVADGCVIEGEVENSVLFRGVKIGKGAKIKNCILMQDTVIEDGATLEYVITDKRAHITAGKELKGEDTFPSFIPKGHLV